MLTDVESPVRQATAHEGAGLLEVSDEPKMSGGYANIYHGFWENSQGERVEVAVKELKALIPRNQHTKDDELIKKTEIRIAREAFVWSRIQHRNLHPLLDYHSQPRPRLISPWCRHGTLLDYLKANPSFSRLDKLKLLYQAAYGLEHLHSRTPPIAHADVKPENVLVNDWREAALSDFGLSRVLHGADIPTGFTTSGIAKGTLRYMSGELFAGEAPACNSDVYAFGGLILTVMSGKPPFYGLPERTIMSRVMQDQPPRPEDHPDLPQCDPLWSLMARCWDGSSKARPSMRTVLWELWECISQEKGLLSVGSTRGDSDMELDTADSAPQATGSSSIRANLVPAKNSLSSTTGVEGTHSLIARRVFYPAREIFRKLEVNFKAIPVLGRYIRAAVEVGFMLIELVKTIDRNQDMANALESNAWKIAVFLDRLWEILSGRREGEVGVCIADIKQELQSAQRHLNEIYSSGLFPKALSCCDHGEGRKQWERAVLKIWEVTELLVHLDTVTLITELKNSHIQEDHRRLLNCLGDGKYGARGNAIEDVICWPGTRVEILDRIDDWISDTCAVNRVLCIRGMAGRGKSTIASTVAHNWQYRASCAIFHCRRGHSALNERIVCALARQLASGIIPGVKNAVLQSVRENEDIADQRLSVQFETLLVAPMSNIKYSPDSILIVVDGLDECENSNNAEDFVRLIDRHSSSLPTNVKFLLTFRPEAALLRTCGARKWLVEDLDSSPNVVGDLEQFFQRAFRQIREDHDLSEDWPSSSDIGRLVEMSQGLFQWARTAVTYISHRLPPHRLHELLKHPSTWNGLDDLYHEILFKAFNNLREDPLKQKLLCQILGILVIAPHPVSLEVVTDLCCDINGGIFERIDQVDVPGYLRLEILADLHSLLLIPTSSSEPLCLMHSSIRDLLVSEQRCKNRAYYIDIIQHHKRLAGGCLSLMVGRLKENICHLSDYSKANSEIQHIGDQEVSPAIRYCCQAWSVHLIEGTQWSRLQTDGPTSLRLDFELFSKEKVLCWLEVMSLVGATTEATLTAKRVHQWLLKSPTELSESNLFTNLWMDTLRFIGHFLEAISFGALHIYLSALAHCPQKTTLWEWYGKHAKIRTVHGIQPSTWSHSLWGRTAGSSVLSVAFLPNSLILASGSRDGTIQWWDADTGAPLVEPLTGHHGSPRSTALLQDGKAPSSGHHGRVVQLWDAQPETLLRGSLARPGDVVLSMAFAPDGKVLASGSGNGTIRFWDAQSGAPLGEPLTSRHGWVSSIAFSSDGAILASGFRKGAIQLWDAHTRAPQGELLGDHDGTIGCLAFSSTNRILASGSWDSIQLWDIQALTPMHELLEGRHGVVSAVAFSPDGKFLASGFGDGTIRLWEAPTWTHLHTSLTGRHDGISSIAFSPDGKTLASGSSDSTIALWNPEMGTTLARTSAADHGRVRSVAFSPNGKVLASGYSDGTIQLCDARTGEVLGEPLAGHHGLVRSVGFSANGKVLASGSLDGTILLWDCQTRMSLREWVPPRHDGVFSFAFSQDGKVLASGSSDGTIRLWNAQTGTLLHAPPTGHQGYVHSLAFSLDGKTLASGSWDRTIRLWDTQTGTYLGEPLTGHSSWVLSLAFSPDGKVLASGSSDGTIRLWNASSQKPLGKPLSDRHSRIRSVAFLPDGKALISRSWDRTIQLWDAQTGTPLGEPLSSRHSEVDTLEFPSGSKVLSPKLSNRENGVCPATARAPLDKTPGGDASTVSSLSIPQGALQAHQTVYCSSLEFRNWWLTSGSSRLLWLPPHYWTDDANYIFQSDRTLAIIYNDSLFIFDISGIV